MPKLYVPFVITGLIYWEPIGFHSRNPTPLRFASLRSTAWAFLHECIHVSLLFTTVLTQAAATATGAMNFKEAAELSHDDALELWVSHQILPPSAWPSQLGQDRWAATFAFPSSDDNRQRYFVEVGAADGLELSNTYALERYLGWRGLCIEASPMSVEALGSNRQCTVVDAVVGARTGEIVRFTSFSDEARRFFSGVAENLYYNKFGNAEEDNHRLMNSIGGIRSSISDGGVVVERFTESLADLLDRHGAPQFVDFLSLDCEGLEADVLEAARAH